MSFKLNCLVLSIVISLVACDLFDPPSVPPLRDLQPTTTPILSDGLTSDSSLVLPPEDEAETQIDEDTTNWTLLVYMDADNNLERYGMEDLREMAAGLIGVSDEALQLVVQIDRAEGYDESDGDWTEARRFVSVDGLLLEQAALGEIDMGSAASLRDFLAWGLREYPAEKYGLIMWGHGVGWQGIAYDQSADSSRLSPAMLHDALREGLDSAEITTLDLIGFDACLMSQLEVYDYLSPVATVAVGSEELIPGSGWNYEDVLSQFASQSSVETSTLASHIVESYINRYQAAGNQLVTLSAIDLQRIAAVKQAVEQLVNSLDVSLSEHLNAISDARGGGESFARYFYQEQDRYAAIDLGRFASLIEQLTPSAAVSEAAMRLTAQLDDAVLLSSSSDNVDFASGLSIYFPRFGRFYDATYADSTSLSAWNNFLTTYHQATVPQPTITISEAGNDR